MTDTTYAKLTGADICEGFEWYPHANDPAAYHLIRVEEIPGETYADSYLGKWYDRIGQEWHDEPPSAEPGPEPLADLPA